MTSPLMPPPLLLAGGIVAILVGVAILRTFGPGYRIGRLLSAAPLVSVADALALAAAGTPRYVRVEGRIDAADEFIDEAGRPLVHRRVRFEVREGDRWRTVSDERRTIPFALSAGLDAIAVDGDALDDGLVVIARESVGVAADAGAVLPAGIDPAAPVRMRVEQVSSVDHAIACGVPALDAGGATRLGAGLGRPLVLTVLGRDDAMRVLAGGNRARPLLATIAFALGALLLVAGLGLGLAGALSPAVVVAAAATPAPSPTPSPTTAAGDVPVAGDTRSSGSGPAFIGAPLLAIGGVLAVGLGAAALTLVYVRLTGGPGR